MSWCGLLAARTDGTGPWRGSGGMPNAREHVGRVLLARDDSYCRWGHGWRAGRGTCFATRDVSGSAGSPATTHCRIFTTVPPTGPLQRNVEYFLSAIHTAR